MCVPPNTKFFWLCLLVMYNLYMRHTYECFHGGAAEPGADWRLIIAKLADIKRFITQRRVCCNIYRVGQKK